jgi:heme-degrading monooxygenase HmoA
MIARLWHGRIRRADTHDYVKYISETGLRDYAQTPGNLGAQMLVDDASEEGVSHVITMSWWESPDAIRAFAGDDIGQARYYPEDQHYLLEFEPHVRHYAVRASLSQGATP